MTSEIMIILFGCVVIFAAGFVQGITGFGFALIAIPLLSKLMPLQSIVPMIVVFSLLTNIFIILKIKQFIDIKKIWFLILSSILVTPLGTYILLVVRPNSLKIIIGIVIVCFALALMKGLRYRSKNQKYIIIPVGIVSGLLNASISLSGPPVVLFLSNEGIDKNVFRANLTAYALILNIVTVGSFFAGGLINRGVMQNILWFTPAMILGVLLGVKVVQRVNENTFRKFTLLLITISGIWLIFSTINT